MEELKQLFVSYEIAKQLKDKGFNAPAFAWYGRQFPNLKLDELHIGIFIGAGDLSCEAPLYQQVIDWLREKRNKVIIVGCNKKATGWYSMICSPDTGGWQSNVDDKDTYYLALESAISTALTLIP